MLPPALEDAVPPPLAGPRAGAPVAALRQDPWHGTGFTLAAFHGPPDALRVVYVLPQFHRSPLLPLTWCSVGQALADAQGALAWLVVRLATRHGVTCLGTEGSAAERLPRSWELDQAAEWSTRLERGAQSFSADEDAGLPARTLADLLQPFVRRHAQALDGPGVAQAHLARAGVHVERFGLEDAELNRRALDLAQRLRALEERLALQEPGSAGAAWDALGDVWQAEHPGFQERVATPVEQALAALDRLRRARRRDGDDGSAADLDRYAALIRQVLQRVLDPEAVAAYRDFYAQLQASPPAAEGPPRLRRTASAAHLGRLRSQLARLQRQYADVVGRQREERAVQRVLRRLGAAPSRTCMLVMGANHVDGLVRALRAQGGADLAIVVLEPGPPETAADSE